MADESLTFRAFGTDVSAGRMFGDLGDKADDAGESIHKLGEESHDLDSRLDETREHLRGLVAEFEKTGDKTLFKDIRKDRSAIKLLEETRKELRGVGDEAEEAFGQAVDAAQSFDVRIEGTRAHLRSLIRELDSTGNVKLLPQISRDRSTISLLESLRKELRGGGEADGVDVGRTFGKGVSKGLGETIGSIPSQLKGVAIIGLVGAAAAAAPLVGAAIAGAVIGGVGLGGIAGGIALAAQDSRVKAEAAKLGSILLGDLKGSASPFIGPLLAEFGELQEIGESFTSDLHKGFVQLAPLIKPLIEGVRGFQQNLGPGLAATFEAAQPAIRAVANELPEVAAALSDMLEAMAEDDRATQGLIGLLHVVEDLTHAVGFFVGYLEYQYDWLTTNGDKLNDIQDRMGPFAATWGLTTSIFADESSDVIDSLNQARDAGGDFNTTIVGIKGSMYDVVSATDAENRALRDFSTALQDQFDPIANFLHRQQDLKKAQQDLNEAIHDHGRKSDEAKAAELRLAEAILAVDAATANAAGSFNGHFTPALRAALKAGGLTEKQINDLQKSAQGLENALHSLEGNYKATVTTEFLSYRADERALSRRASGGPVMAGTSYWVGENGPEIVTFGRNGTVIPASQSKAVMSGASGGSALAVNVSVQPSAHARDLLSQLVLEMLRVDASFRSTVGERLGA